MYKIKVPVSGNSYLKNIEDTEKFGYLNLRYNGNLDFIENTQFDPILINYDVGYQSNGSNSEIYFNHLVSVLELLKSNFLSKSKIVEVGCGKGAFLEIIENDNYFDFEGYDTSYNGNNPKIQKKYLSPNEKIFANVVVLRHVLEHIKLPHLFLKNLYQIFGEISIYIEVPNLTWMKSNQAYYDICYEHVNYFSIKSLRKLFKNNSILDSGESFNGQYIFILANLGSLSEIFELNYGSDEEWSFLTLEGLFPSMQKTMFTIDSELQGKNKAYIWGGATKGCMFLVHCQNKWSFFNKIEAVVDINPLIHGLLMPGSLKPIISPNKFLELIDDNDVLIISNPNYADEIKSFLLANSSYPTIIII
jgi:hypothetical protein